MDFTDRRLLLLRRLAGVCAAVVLLVTSLSAFMRLSHAGLGCTDWPQCYGQRLRQLQQGSPVSADEQSATPAVRVLHRVLATAALLLVVSMVLVWPTFQRRGLASTLLRHALSQLASRGMAAVLDATPAGYDVYVHEGFKPTWGFARYRRERAAGALVVEAAPVTCPLRDAHWSDIEAIDALAFGASRLPLLRTLAARWPAAARVVEQCGRVRGAMWGRTGREAHQIGPLLADDLPAAQALISHALSAEAGPIYLDLLDERRAALLPWLERQGFVLQRPFTRMVWGADNAPGDTRRIWAAAGPEFG